jgi:predicted MPP superfamily phosphohydrolase
MEYNFNFHNKKILTISDMHCPYEHKDAFKFLAALKKKYKPDLVVCLGDMVDWHSISFHPKDPDLAGAGDELTKIRAKVQKLEVLFPKMIIVGSNHGDLPLRKLKDAGLPKHFLRNYNDIYGVGKGWVFCDDLMLKSKDESIYIAHSISKDVRKVAAQRGVHHICGHHHTIFEISYVSNPRNLLWGVNGGCLIDKEALAFEYGKLTLDRPIIGTPVVLFGQPKLEPMLLNKQGRWIGRLL